MSQKSSEENRLKSNTISMIEILLSMHMRSSSKDDEKVSLLKKTLEKKKEEFRIIQNRNAQEKRQTPAESTDYIRQIVEVKEIKTLVHFSNVKNITSILHSGIMPRADLDAQSIEYSYFDSSRWDGQLDRSCFSIEFPNYYMLAKKHNQSYQVLEFDKDARWDKDMFCIFGVDSSLLWERDCIFCQSNAAATGVLAEACEYINQGASLKALFNDPIEYKAEAWYRSHLLPLKYPTQSQAEVLIKGLIPVSHIKWIAFESKGSLERSLQEIELPTNIEARICPDFFQGRVDYMVQYPNFRPRIG
jgi:hypothetical protein